MISLSDFVNRFQLQLPPPPKRLLDNNRHAAVLLPIICKPKPTLLLTRRSATLRSHAGQVAFPGGAADPKDKSIIATALREAEEEVNIPHQKVQVLGQLAPLNSTSGYLVTPIVGLLPPGLSLHSNPEEVAKYSKFLYQKRFHFRAIIILILTVAVSSIVSIFTGTRDTSSGG